MTTHRLSRRGTPTVVDLGARRAAKALPSVSVRRRRSGRWTVIEVTGEMDLQVLPLVPALLVGNASHVVFELGRVTFLDASGIGMMVDRQRTAHAAGGSVRLAAPSRQARRILMLTGSDRVFLMFDSLDEAVSTPLEAGPGPAS